MFAFIGLNNSFENRMLQSYFLSNGMSSLSNSIIQEWCEASGYVQQMGNLASQLSLFALTLKHSALASPNTRVALSCIWIISILLLQYNLYYSLSAFDNYENLCIRKFNEPNDTWENIEILKIFSSTLTFTLSVMSVSDKVSQNGLRQKYGFFRVFSIILFDTTLVLLHSLNNLYHSLGIKSNKRFHIASVYVLQLIRTIATPLLFLVMRHRGHRLVKSKQSPSGGHLPVVPPKILSTAKYPESNDTNTNHISANFSTRTNPSNSIYLSTGPRERNASSILGKDGGKQQLKHLY